MTSDPITLAEAEPSDFRSFKSELQAAFAMAIVDEFGELPDGPIPSDADLDAAMSAPDAVVLRITGSVSPVSTPMFLCRTKANDAMKTIAVLCFAAFALTSAAEAGGNRTAHYGGVAQVHCSNRTGCHVNPNYAAQLKRQQERNAKMNLR